MSSSSLKVLNVAISLREMSLISANADPMQVDLVWTDNEKVFDPEDVYGDAPNPTIL